MEEEKFEDKVAQKTDELTVVSSSQLEQVTIARATVRHTDVSCDQHSGVVGAPL